MEDLKLTWSRCPDAPDDWIEYHADTTHHYLKVWRDYLGIWRGVITRKGDWMRRSFMFPEAVTLAQAETQAEKAYFLTNH